MLYGYSAFAGTRSERDAAIDTARLMVFKLLIMTAAKTWRRLKGENQLPKVVAGATFRNGVEVTSTPKQTAA
jgi:putative transposase